MALWPCPLLSYCTVWSLNRPITEEVHCGSFLIQNHLKEEAFGPSSVGLELKSLWASSGTHLHGCDGRLVLAQLVELLLHVAQDDGPGRGVDTQLLAPGPQHVLVLPLRSTYNKHTKGNASTGLEGQLSAEKWARKVGLNDLGKSANCDDFDHYCYQGLVYHFERSLCILIFQHINGSSQHIDVLR